jgi:hypothetical protein
LHRSPSDPPGRTGPYIDPHSRVRHEQVDKAGTVTLRYNSRLPHISVGRLHAGTRVTLLIDDLHIRIIDRHTGELLRELTLDPSRDFQPRGVPPGPPKKNPSNATMSRDTCQRCLETSHGRADSV